MIYQQFIELIFSKIGGFTSRKDTADFQHLSNQMDSSDKVSKASLERKFRFLNPPRDIVITTRISPVPNSIPFDIILSVTGNTVCPLSVITFLGKIEIRPGKRVYTIVPWLYIGRRCEVDERGRCVCIQLHRGYTRIYIRGRKDSRRLRNAIELTARYRRGELPSDVLLSSSPRRLFIVYSRHLDDKPCPPPWPSAEQRATSLRSSKPPLTPCRSCYPMDILSNGQLNPPFEGKSVKGQRLDGETCTDRPLINSAVCNALMYRLSIREIIYFPIFPLDRRKIYY